MVRSEYRTTGNASFGIDASVEAGRAACNMDGRQGADLFAEAQCIAAAVCRLITCRGEGPRVHMEPTIAVGMCGKLLLGEGRQSAEQPNGCFCPRLTLKRQT